MNSRRIFFGKRRLLGLLELLALNLLGLFSCIVLTDAIHRDSMRDRVQPRAQGTGVFQLANAVECLDPDLLKHVERRVRIADETGCVVEQWPLHHRNQVLERPWFARLATQRHPLVLCSILAIHGLSLLMSKETLWWFN